MPRVKALVGNLSPVMFALPRNALPPTAAIAPPVQGLERSSSPEPAVGAPTVIFPLLSVAAIYQFPSVRTPPE